MKFYTNIIQLMIRHTGIDENEKTLLEFDHGVWSQFCFSRQMLTSDIRNVYLPMKAAQNPVLSTLEKVSSQMMQAKSYNRTHNTHFNVTSNLQFASSKTDRQTGKTADGGISQNSFQSSMNFVTVASL